MRKALLLAVAVTLALAGVAYAVNNKYVVKANITPVKSGTPAKPTPVSQHFEYDISSQFKGQIPTNVHIYRTFVLGILENTGSFVACGTSRLNDPAEGPRTCPSGSRIGTGFALNYVNPSNRPPTKAYAKVCRLEVWIYNGGNHALSLYFVRGTHVTAPCPLPHGVAIVAGLATGPFGLTESFSIPNFLRHPVTGQTWTIYQLTQNEPAKKKTVTVKVNGKKTKKTIGLFSSYSCPTNHERLVSVTFTEIDGTHTPATRNVPCS